MTIYSQRDSQWANLALGFGPDTIGADGCYLTADAMCHSWAGHALNPAQLNDVYKAKGIYVQGELLKDSALADCFPDLWKVDSVYNCASVPCDQTQLNNTDPNLYVVVEITNPAGNLTHFMPVVDWSTWTVGDPWTGEKITVGQVGTNFGWGSDPARLIVKAVKLRYIGAQTGGPTWTGIVDKDGVNRRAYPGADAPSLGVYAPGTSLTFDAWCAYGDAIPDDITNVPDNRWFRVQDHSCWVASAEINGNPGPSAQQLDPITVRAAPPGPVVVPAPTPATPPADPTSLGLAGIDVSQYQGTIDWNALKAAGKVKWVMIRSSYGCPGVGESDSKYLDTEFTANWSAAKSAGISRLAYHFAYPSFNKPEDEASFFIRVVAPELRIGDGFMLDLEGDGMKNGAVVGAANLDDWASTFLAAVANALGYKGWWYSSPAFISQYGLGPKLGGYPLVVAAWGSTKPVLSAPLKVVAWQYADNTAQSGISGNVDGDVFLGDQVAFSTLLITSLPTSVSPPDYTKQISDLQTRVAALEGALIDAKGRLAITETRIANASKALTT